MMASGYNCELIGQQYTSQPDGKEVVSYFVLVTHKDLKQIISKMKKQLQCLLCQAKENVLCIYIMEVNLEKRILHSENRDEHLEDIMQSETK